MQGEQSQKQDNFRIENPNIVNQEIIDSAKKAISMVWKKNVGTQEKFNLSFCHTLTDENGQNSNRSSEYNPNTDTITLAIKRAETNAQQLKLSIKDAVLLLAAHETMHKFQVYREDKLIPGPKENEISDIPTDYYHQKQEVEAWNEALNLFKKIHPNSQGGFTLGTKQYTIPKSSSY